MKLKLKYMEKVTFNPSKKSTVGVEVEAQIVDNNTCLLYTSDAADDC